MADYPSQQNTRVTVTSTTVTASRPSLDFDYIKTLPGILRIVEIVSFIRLKTFFFRNDRPRSQKNTILTSITLLQYLRINSLKICSYFKFHSFKDNIFSEPTDRHGYKTIYWRRSFYIDTWKSIVFAKMSIVWNQHFFGSRRRSFKTQNWHESDYNNSWKSICFSRKIGKQFKNSHVWVCIINFHDWWYKWLPDVFILQHKPYHLR